MALKFQLDLPPVSHDIVSNEVVAGRRLFIVGDIHGCLDEFKALLCKAGVTSDNTLIICCGDLVNKGPKSCETVEFIRSLGSRAVRSVRGNHDERVIHEWNEFDANPSRTENKYSWVKNMSREDANFLFNQPYTIGVPSFNLIVVHAGLVPEIPLNSQQLFDMTTMRGVVKAANGSYSATESKDVGPWAALWPGPQHVYFGHNASRGLQRHAFATGLDTGCVYGRQLTGAIIPSPHEQPVLVSVLAEKVHSIPNI